MSDQTVSFVRSLVMNFPGLEALLQEHLEDNFGEILPSVFLGELTRYLLSLLYAADSGEELSSRRELKQIMDYLEQSYSGNNEEVKELISTSFLENLPQPGEDGASIRDIAGPILRKQLRALE